MKEFKGTKGYHQVMYSNGICIGTGIKHADNPNYYTIICNSILPNNDIQYKIEKDRIQADMQLYAASIELLEALQSAIAFVKHNVPQPPIVIEQVQKWERAINKALSTTDYN